MSILVPPPLDPSPSTSSSSSSLASLPQQKERRIRFAPLPIPPCDQDDETSILNDDADFDQVGEDDESTLNNSKLTADASTPIDNQSLNDSKGTFFDGDERSTSPCYRSKPTTQQLLSHPPISNAPTWTRPKSLNLLRPFPFRRSSPSASSHSLTPTLSIDSATTPTNASRTSFNTKRRKSSISAEDILTLGATKLFRTTSKPKEGSDSRRNSTSSWASSLWSGGSTSNLHGSRPSSPSLRRTESMQSTQSTASSKSKLGSAIRGNATKPRSSSVSSNTSTSSAGLPSTSTSKTKVPPRPKSADPTKPSRKGIRMLNGRVYGSKRNRENVNHFANIKDEEPSFVEWGYGGMGSVKGGKHAGVDDRWQRLHGTAEVTTTANSKATVDDDDDDGTGMAWVKRRKEQREREKKEREEKEKAEADAANAVESSPEASPTTTESTEALPSTDSVPAPPPSAPVATETDAPQPSLPSAPTSPSHSGTPVVSPTPSGGLSTPHLEHNLEAISIPAAHPRRHKHGRSVSRTSSLDATSMNSQGHIPLSSSPGVSALAAPSPLSQMAAKEEQGVSSESEEESDSEVGTQGDDEDDDEDEDDELQQELNRQALCAGVEKISRHHENN